MSFKVVTNKVFADPNACQTILSFLDVNQVESCAKVSKAFKTNVTGLQKKALQIQIAPELRSYRAAYRRVSSYRKVFANHSVREYVLSFLPQQDLDRARRTRSSWNRNIIEFQDVSVRRLFPAELSDVVARATFQNLADTIWWPNQDELSATVVVGYRKGKPYLACKANVFWGKFTEQSVLLVKRRYSDGGWYVDGSKSDFLMSSVSKFAEFVKVGKMAPEWARQERDGCCTRIYYVFRRMCCGVVRPTIVWPELRLPDEKSASDKQENKKA